MPYLFAFAICAIVGVKYLGLEIPGENTIAICGLVICAAVAGAWSKFWKAPAQDKADVIKTNLRDTVFVYKETEQEIKNLLKNYDREE